MQKLSWKFQVDTNSRKEEIEVEGETRREAMLELCRALGIGGCKTYARACLRKYYKIKLLSYKFSPGKLEHVISFQ